MILHAGLVALHLGGYWKGALILGASGAGKSDLALRAIDAGFRLVADDRVIVWVCEGRLFGRAPGPLTGLIEVRGMGVLRTPALDFCEIMLAVRCGEAERLPDAERAEICGVPIPSQTLKPLEASAPAKLRRALQHLGQAAEGAYQHSPVACVLPRPGGDSR